MTVQRPLLTTNENDVRKTTANDDDEVAKDERKLTTVVIFWSGLLATGAGEKEFSTSAMQIAFRAAQE